MPAGISRLKDRQPLADHNKSLPGTLRVAIVHDWLNQIGGAEAVLETLVDMFPGAPVFTTIYWASKMPDRYREWDIRPTWLDRVPFVHRHHQLFLPLYPLAVESMNLEGFDLILSNKSGFCHGVPVLPGQLHIDYCLTPTRYVWDFDYYVAREGLGKAAKVLLGPLIHRLQGWDRRAADGVHHFVAISQEVKNRIARIYERDSVVIYPPVDTRRFRLASQAAEDFLLVASRLIPYKRIDLAVQACSRLGLPLMVVGDGRDRGALEAMAGPTVRFLGRVSDQELSGLMSRCRAFLFPGKEDFGIAPVEAQAAGRPVIAFAEGGALDTIVEGETGLFFREQTPEALAAAIQALDDYDFDPELIRRNADRFGVDRFKNELQDFISTRWQEFDRNGRRG